MKGTSFQNGVEFKVTIDGESWQQTQAISGQLQTIVRGSPASPVTPRVILAESTERKIKNKSADAYQILSEASGDDATSWKFNIPRQARITDKAGSLYILYGASDDVHALGQLRLNIVPHHYLQDMVEILRTQFRFALKKTTAGKKGWVEAELTPPASKDWAQLDHLILGMLLTEDTIETKFSFHRAEVDALKAGLQTKITLREVMRSLPIADHVHDFNDRLNKDATEAAINDVIEEYRSVGWLA